MRNGLYITLQTNEENIYRGELIITGFKGVQERDKPLINEITLYFQKLDVQKLSEQDYLGRKGRGKQFNLLFDQKLATLLYFANKIILDPSFFSVTPSEQSKVLAQLNQSIQVERENLLNIKEINPKLNAECERISQLIAKPQKDDHRLVEQFYKDFRSTKTNYKEHTKHRIYSTAESRYQSLRDFKFFCGKIAEDKTTGPNKFILSVGCLINELETVKKAHRSQGFFSTYFTRSTLAGRYERLLNQYKKQLSELGYNIDKQEDRSRLLSKFKEAGYEKEENKQLSVDYGSLQ